MVPLDRFLGEVQRWAEARPDLEAVALLGSRTRGQARPDSDVDLLLITNNARLYLDDTSWAESFGEVERSIQEQWGNVVSLRVWYRDSWEVEFAVAGPQWAQVPMDPGARRAIEDGMRVLLDRTGRLTRLG
jgi:predicted nucleotidyltransferase